MTRQDNHFGHAVQWRSISWGEGMGQLMLRLGILLVLVLVLPSLLAAESQIAIQSIR